MDSFLEDGALSDGIQYIRKFFSVLLLIQYLYLTNLLFIDLYQNLNIYYIKVNVHCVRLKGNIQAKY